jgi:hypothetical protein
MLVSCPPNRLASDRPPRPVKLAPPTERQGSGKGTAISIPTPTSKRSPQSILWRRYSNLRCIRSTPTKRGDWERMSRPNQMARLQRELQVPRIRFTTVLIVVAGLTFPGLSSAAGLSLMPSAARSWCSINHGRLASPGGSSTKSLASASLLSRASL